MVRIKPVLLLIDWILGVTEERVKDDPQIFSLYPKLLHSKNNLSLIEEPQGTISYRPRQCSLKLQGYQNKKKKRLRII